MPMPRGADAYRRIEAESRSPLELVVMLYDGALRFVNEAQQANQGNDLIRRGRAVSRAMAIVAELQNTLNVREGGAIGEELDRLYSYINSRLVAVNSTGDAGALQEVGKLLLTLRDAWAQIAPGTPKVGA
jgi:flagellar protein FliS